jgi:aminoglycoside/choline kinase family phosphotransferase
VERIAEDIHLLLKHAGCNEPVQIEKIPQSGSDRTYSRVHTTDGQSFILTQGNNLRENQVFIALSRHFKKSGIAVPEIMAVSPNQDCYLQEDMGNISLLHVLEAEGYTDRVYSLFRKSLQQLAILQIKGHEGWNYDNCLTNKTFGQQAILADLLYFKYYFLDTLKIAYDKQKLIDEFEQLSAYLAQSDHRYFMFRDFQSRNIMIQNDQVRFIDYQGGMQGALQYDVASLLWQAKANLPEEWKNRLLEDYIGFANALLQQDIDRERFIQQYNGYVLIRLLQVLGAYGFRGLFERKAHFLSSIPQAMQNLKWFVANHPLGMSCPVFETLLQEVVADETLHRFHIAKATETTPLVVNIQSFSYLKNGYPVDDSDNGGGFVFDCRGILNPGRIDMYKKLSGLDKPVKDFLEQETLMPGFLNSIFDIVDVSVENYIQRNFSNLQINFGCTGGQHRSVYAAEAVSRHLKNKFGVKTTITHLNQENWVR